jgi:hypothetical protein
MLSFFAFPDKGEKYRAGNIGVFEKHLRNTEAIGVALNP